MLSAAAATRPAWRPRLCYFRSPQPRDRRGGGDLQPREALLWRRRGRARGGGGGEGGAGGGVGGVEGGRVDHWRVL